MNTNVAKVLQLVETFDKHEGRRPRILIAKMGQDCLLYTSPSPRD